MKNVIYILIQCTWGLPQTLLGFIVLLINIKNKHYFYHGAIITERNVPSSVSLGMFVFTTTNPMKDKRTKNKIPDEELSKRLLVHEYGHTIQSLIFGPLYLIVMGIPSTLWGFLPYFQNKKALQLYLLQGRIFSAVPLCFIVIVTISFVLSAGFPVITDLR